MFVYILKINTIEDTQQKNPTLSPCSMTLSVAPEISKKLNNLNKYIHMYTHTCVYTYVMIRYIFVCVHKDGFGVFFI